MNEAINQQEIKKLNAKLIDAEKKLALEMEDKKKREADLEKAQMLLKSSLESQRDIGMDLAERKKMEAEIVEAKEYFEFIFNTNPDVALVSRLSDGVIVDVNDGFIKMSGYTREEAIGKSSLSTGLFQDMNDRKKITDALMEKGFIE